MDEQRTNKGGYCDVHHHLHGDVFSCFVGGVDGINKRGSIVFGSVQLAEQRGANHNFVKLAARDKPQRSAKLIKLYPGR